jgi:transcriptional regulator NrdR family protein
MKQAPGKSDDRGISCPRCGCRHFYTTHTEPLRDGRVRRRKVCRYCGRKLLTFEAATAKPAAGRDGPLSTEARSR